MRILSWGPMGVVHDDRRAFHGRVCGEPVSLLSLDCIGIAGEGWTGRLLCSVPELGADCHQC